VSNDQLFYDPLLHLPPRLLEEERRRQLSSTFWGADGLLILIPLRLGLAGLNPIYIPGNQFEISRLATTRSPSHPFTWCIWLNGAFGLIGFCLRQFEISRLATTH
jgi:hypothetical protein